MDLYTKTLQELVVEFERLPGIGRKTAERLAYYILRAPTEEAMRLAYAIREVKQKVKHCGVCYNLTEAERCEICEDPERDRSVLCVVEQPKDLYAIENSGSYRGIYHVLLGCYTPLEGGTPDALTVKALVQRLRGGEIAEVILATNPNFEGEGTALYLQEQLKSLRTIKVTKIARGVPSGTKLEHVARNIVADALDGRREMPEDT